jgi:hypothetical protein
MESGFVVALFCASDKTSLILSRLEKITIVYYIQFGIHVLNSFMPREQVLEYAYRYSSVKLFFPWRLFMILLKGHNFFSAEFWIFSFTYSG